MTKAAKKVPVRIVYRHCGKELDAMRPWQALLLAKMPRHFLERKEETGGR